MVGVSSTLASQFQSLPVLTFSVWGSILLPLQYRLFFQAFLAVASCLSHRRAFSWQTTILHEREDWDWKVDLTVYHPKYINCELCTLAIIIYTINKVHLVAKQHLSLILDLSRGIWPLDLRNLEFHPICRTCFRAPAGAAIISALYLPPLAGISPSRSSSQNLNPERLWVFSQHNSDS